MFTVRTQGQSHLENRKPIILGLSCGNPYYYQKNNLYKIFQFGHQNSDKVKFFIPEIIWRHSLKAIGTANPERSMKKQSTNLRNKCFDVIKDILSKGNKKDILPINWEEDIENSDPYTEELTYIFGLFQSNPEFRRDVLEATGTALKNLISSRKIDGRESQEVKETEGPCFDVIEGSNYILKEFAFFMAVPRIYEDFKEYILVYHRDCPVLENLFNGDYDGKIRPYFGYVIVP